MGQGDLLLNEAGCVALVTGDATPSSCAVKEYLLRSCALASCADCPLDGPEDVPNWDACMQASTGSTCASYAGPAACVQKVAPQCVNGSDFGTRFQAIAPLFCGP